jgi:phosphoribosylformylglycinamidine cyclo-ligase
MSRYEESGVSIGQGDTFVNLLKGICETTYDEYVLEGVGGFAALYRIPGSSTVLAASTDGVGSKTILAEELGRYGYQSHIGVDLVAMVMNDVIVCGAQPLFMLNCYSLSDLTKYFDRSINLIENIAVGCLSAGCALIGGETAEMPATYDGSQYDLAGFGIGVVQRSEILGQHRVKRGDVIIGLESSGPHSNGYTLINEAYRGYDWLTDPFDEAKRLIKPTIIYANTIRKLLSDSSHGIHAMAHITGGGLEANTRRSIPTSMKLKIHWESWERPEIFQRIQTRARISEDEMRSVFNCGIGFTLIVNPDTVERIQSIIPFAKIIGRVE